MKERGRAPDYPNAGHERFTEGASFEFSSDESVAETLPDDGPVRVPAHLIP